jgi:AcrR family transcriptional regulator
MRTLCERDFAALADAFAQVQETADPLERIEQIGRIYIDFAVQHPNHYKLMFLTPAPVEPTAEVLGRQGGPRYDGYAALKTALEEALASGCLRPDYQDLELVAQTLWAGVHGVASLQIALDNDPGIAWRALATRSQMMTELLLHGLVIN